MLYRLGIQDQPGRCLGHVQTGEAKILLFERISHIMLKNKGVQL